MEFTAQEIARITRGSLHGPDVVVRSAAIDSRIVQPGELFVPIVSVRDGHDFVPTALESGAVAYLTARPSVGGSAIEVEDTLDALTRLASIARDRLPEAVIGVTGSVGKTSVKDLLGAALATTFRTTASARSFNNEIGVPLTLVNAPADTEVLVQEMGARGVGHIDHLCRIARPTAAIVTMVAEVHTSEFVDIDEVAVAKAELVQAVPVDGFVVLNQSDARVRAMARHTEARVLTFGVAGDVVAERVELDDHLRPRFRLSSPWGRAEVSLAVHGIHQVANALAAAAGALAHGVPVEAVAAGLAGARLSAARMDLTRTASGAIVINDAYNANPTSVAAALHSLAALDVGRRTAVLGLMAELGEHSEARHAEIGALASDLDIEVISVACPAYGVGIDVPSGDAAVAALGPLRAGDAVLVKASRSVNLQTVAEALLAPPAS